MTNAVKYTCVECGGPAIIVRRRPGPGKEDVLFTFQCADCAAEYMLEGHSNGAVMIFSRVRPADVAHSPCG